MTAIPRNRYLLSFSRDHYDRFNNPLYTDDCRKYCIIRAHMISQARDKAKALRGLKYLSIRDLNEEVKISDLIHKKLLRVSASEVDIMNCEWVLKPLGGGFRESWISVPNIGNPRENILHAIVDSFDTLKNIKQLDLCLDAEMTNRYILRIKKGNRMFTVSKVEKLEPSQAHEIK